jgi:hypothetical protein
MHQQYWRTPPRFSACGGQCQQSEQIGLTSFLRFNSPRVSRNKDDMSGSLFETSSNMRETRDLTWNTHNFPVMSEMSINKHERDNSWSQVKHNGVSPINVIKWIYSKCLTRDRNQSRNHISTASRLENRN